MLLLCYSRVHVVAITLGWWLSKDFSHSDVRGFESAWECNILVISYCAIITDFYTAKQVLGILRTCCLLIGLRYWIPVCSFHGSIGGCCYLFCLLHNFQLQFFLFYGVEVAFYVLLGFGGSIGRDRTGSRFDCYLVFNWQGFYGFIVSLFFTVLRTVLG